MLRLILSGGKSFDAISALEKDFSQLEKKVQLGKVADAEGAEGAVGNTSVYFPRIVASPSGRGCCWCCVTARSARFQRRGLLREVPHVCHKA